MTRSAPRRLLALLLCACVLALPACDSDDDEGGRPSIAGTWRAENTSTVGGEEGTQALTMTLTESEDGEVSGEGEFQIEGFDELDLENPVYTFDVTGTFDPPDADLTFTIDEVNESEFEGDNMAEGNFVLSDDGERLEGTAMAGDVTFVRQ